METTHKDNGFFNVGFWFARMTVRFLLLCCHLEIWGEWLLWVGLLPWVTIEPNDRFVDSPNVSVQVQW